MAETPWWSGAVGYEIYPRSFADSDGDGVGDLEGIRSRLEYVQWLGVDAIWITPFYPSPGFDHGYDITAYRAVSDLHGSIDDFDRLVEDAKRRGLRVLVDIVPNHTSAWHPWFREAVKSRDNPFRDYYVWRDAAPGGGVPNNWVSHFGGPAWTLDHASGQYYCHLFLPEQPDLNWSNEAVRNEFDEILLFWCERGVDGFRIDVAHGLSKDPQFRDNPSIREVRDPADPADVFRSFDHRHDLDQDSNVEIFRRWNRVVAPHGVMLIGEVGTHDPVRLSRYVRAGDALHTAFYLRPVWRGWEPERLLADLRAVHGEAPSGISWVINNHDSSRSVARYGGGAEGVDRSLAVTTLLLALGGVPFLYQGEELGLEDGKIDPADLEDPIATRNEHGHGRDGCRTAMPWDASHENGFTSAPYSWLRAAPRSVEETVAGQREVAGSTLSTYRGLIATRKSLPDLWEAPLEWLTVPTETAAAVARRSVVAAANLGEDDVAITLPPGTWEVRFASRRHGASVANGLVHLTARSGALLVRSQP